MSTREGTPRRRTRALAALRLGSTLRLAALAAPAIALGAASAPPAAHAQPKKKDPKLAEAKKLFDEGADAYADGRYEDAVKAWEKSYELSGKPLIFESIGNAYERLGDKKKARDYLARWRAEAPPAEHEQLDARIKNLDARIAAAEAAEKEKQEAEAKKEANEAAAAKAKKDEAKATDEARRFRLWAGVAMGGVGVLAIGAGLAVGAVGLGQQPDPNTACATNGDRTLCKASAKGAFEGSASMALAGDITWIAGAVFAGAGAIMLVTLVAEPAPPAKPGQGDPSTQGRTPRPWVSVAPVVGPTFSGVGVTGAF